MRLRFEPKACLPDTWEKSDIIVTGLKDDYGHPMAIYGAKTIIESVFSHDYHKKK